ncbi:MAG: NAD-dependent epimerase/dehydratase family protein [Solirubrobacteraceae bacterium]
MIGVTGANGYVGGRILAYLRARGIDTIALVRRPDPADRGARRYALAEPLADGLLDGIDTVVHAAYDLSGRGAEIRAVNCLGSMGLFDALAGRGGRVVLISSLSAFEGARSLYGQAKLELERAALERGGVVLRPGLVFGKRAGGLFGTIVEALASSGPAPLVGGGRQRLFLTHDEYLGELVAMIADGSFDPKSPVFAAHEVPSTLRGLAAQIAETRPGHRWVIPLPAGLVYLGLRCAEVAHLPLSFRSDSVLSLTHPIPLDQVAALERSPVGFPPFRPELWAEV